MRSCPECKQKTELPTCPHDGTPTLDEAVVRQTQDVILGKIFDGRYQIIDRIGKGGMGSVYRARQLSMGREVALKVLNPELMSEPEAAGRFVREAKVASRLRHTNTIVVYDFGQSTDGLYLVMELLEGEPLSARLREGRRLAPTEASRIGASIARSLAEAHSLGIVHRDLKPDNVFLHRIHGGQEVVKVLDFGVAKFIQDEVSINTSMFETGRPMISGTLTYISPEAARGAPLDARADLYSLGVLLYRALSGRVPFFSDTPVVMLRMHMEDTPPALPDEIPLPMRELVMRLMSKDPNARPATAEEVATFLERFAVLVEDPVREGATPGPSVAAPAVPGGAPSSAGTLSPSKALAQAPTVALPESPTALRPTGVMDRTSAALGETAVMPWEQKRRPGLVDSASARTQRRVEEDGPPSFVGPLAALLVMAGLIWYFWSPLSEIFSSVFSK